MAIFIHDPNIRVVTPLSVDLQRRTIQELSQTSAITRVHENEGVELRPAMPRDYRHPRQGNDAEGQNTDLKGRKVVELMTPQVFTIPSTATWEEARERLQTHGIKHLLVIDPNNQLMGLLHERDLLRYPDQKMPTSDSPIPIRAVTTVTPDTLIQVVAFVMLERHQDAVLVVDGGRAVGMLTLKDLLKLFLGPAAVEDWA